MSQYHRRYDHVKFMVSLLQRDAAITHYHMTRHRNSIQGLININCPDRDIQHNINQTIKYQRESAAYSAAARKLMGVE